MAAIPRIPPWTGPAVLSYGFRPFFLLAGIQALWVGLVWSGHLVGWSLLPAGWPPVVWHGHELVFGYGSAALAGFLLTAIPNWTGRLPLAGLPLLGLAGLWMLARGGVALADRLAAPIVAAADLLFPVVLVVVSAREVIVGRNHRNLPVVGLVGAFALAQAGFHLELARTGQAALTTRAGVAILLLLVMLIGGRIVPSFTTNWLRHHRPGRPLPAAFDRFDQAALLAGAAGLVPWVAAAIVEPPRWAGLVVILAGLAHFGRLARWRPLETGGEPLLAVLHLGYLFVPIGFLAAGGGRLAGLSELEAAATHLWTMGAIGLVTLAVMTRATRGHTGRALVAPPGTVALYGLVVVATALRFMAAVAPATGGVTLPAAGLAWAAAFALFLLLYGPMLLGPRVPAPIER